MARSAVSAGLVLAAALAAGMAPVPKDSRKEDPSGFPAADAPQWKKRDGGLKVWDVKEGTGAEVKPGATVTVRYIGWLADGTVFDSTHKDAPPRLTEGEPITLGLAHLIRGWQEGLPGMRVGGVRRLSIPPELGYGARGTPPKVPANATLVFVVEVVKVEDK